MQRLACARAKAAWEWGGYGLRTRADASGGERANLGGHPAPRPPEDRRLHGWCRKTLNGKVAFGNVKYYFAMAWNRQATREPMPSIT